MNTISAVKNIGLNKFPNGGKILDKLMDMDELVKIGDEGERYAALIILPDVIDLMNTEGIRAVVWLDSDGVSVKEQGCSSRCLSEGCYDPDPDDEHGYVQWYTGRRWAYYYHK